MTTPSRSLLKRELIFCLFLSAVSTPVMAAQSGGCSVTSNTLSFGSYDVFSPSPLNSSGTIKVRCSPGSTPYVISLDNGLYGPITNRKMRSSTSNHNLNYNLYVDATYVTVWGDGTGGSVTVSGNKPNDYTVYGRIPPQQDVGVGSYGDIITVTVNF